jgi:hypothetical protein
VTLSWFVAPLLVLAAFAGPVRAGQKLCAPPVVIDDGWENAEPQASGIDASALCAVMESAAGGPAMLRARREAAA